MIERVIFTPEADDDVAESYNWYESREPGLGEDFLRCIEASLRGIQRQTRCAAGKSTVVETNLGEAPVSNPQLQCSCPIPMKITDETGQNPSNRQPNCIVTA